MSAHTPGPWRRDSDGFVRCPDGQLLMGPHRTRAEVEANTDLIAKAPIAPKLAEALREMLAAGDDCVRAEDDQAAMLRFGEAHTAAVAALAEWDAL